MAKSDNKSASSEGQDTQTEQLKQQFLIQRVYLKDLSFEAPLGAKAFTSKVQPKVAQELAIEVNKLDDSLYELVLKLTVTAKLEDDTAFLVEVQQAGIFFIQGIEAEKLPRLLNTVCPQVLFPYAREVIDSCLIKGSFPPVMLPPVNFEGLYATALAEKKAKAH